MDPLLEAAHAAWTRAAQEALQKTAEQVLKAASQDAPYDPAPDEPHLRDSGRVEPIDHRAGGVMAIEIVFPGPYAALQHERQDYKHPHGGKPKFLEHNLQCARLAESIAAAEAEVLR